MMNALIHLVVLNVHVMMVDTRLVVIRHLALVSTCKKYLWIIIIDCIRNSQILTNVMMMMVDVITLVLILMVAISVNAMMDIVWI